MGGSGYSFIGFDLGNFKWLLHAMTLSLNRHAKHTAMGIGMWLGIIMAFNVWFVVVRPKRALGIVDCDPELKAKSANCMLFSRTNTLLSLPMLLSMVAQNLY